MSILLVNRINVTKVSHNYYKYRCIDCKKIAGINIIKILYERYTLSCER